ncbi:MAG: hypothetical protein A4E28_02153 [Methanocella sp. PtaU1.Bin125]|nr:MAG: hypothetical protein A4E28_02153 [Methanocella sp. PtaU1.Bin125]
MGLKGLLAVAASAAAVVPGAGGLAALALPGVILTLAGLHSLFTAMTLDWWVDRMARTQGGG